MNNLLFSEKQRFRQWWLWALLIGLNITLLSILLTQLISGKPVGDHPAGNSFNLLNYMIILGTTLLFLSFRLETNITDEAVHVRFFPFHRKFRTYTWDMIVKAYTREYKPLMEYGGWACAAQERTGP